MGTCFARQRYFRDISAVLPTALPPTYPKNHPTNRPRRVLFGPCEPIRIPSIASEAVCLKNLPSARRLSPATA